MPGVVQLSVDNTILADHPGTIVTGEVTMSGTARVDYTLDKNQRFVDFHLDRANQARPFAASGYVYSCFTSVGKCIATLSKLATSDGTSRALTVLGLIAAIADRGHRRRDSRGDRGLHRRRHGVRGLHGRHTRETCG